LFPSHDQSATQQDSVAVNDATEYVSITNNHTAAIRVAVRDSGAFTINNSNSRILNPGATLDQIVNGKAQGNIISIINVT
jgi:hypothetical protein